MTPWWVYGGYSVTFAALCWLSIYRRHAIPDWMLPVLLGAIAFGCAIKMLVKGISL